MADQPPDTGVPRWVKVAGVIVGVLVLLVVVMALIGGGLGNHGPDRHTSGDGAAERTEQGALEPRAPFAGGRG
ncbi:hypothetical protein [Allosalinactinospora lopnorensis]|uniref:hypothetical protein n=1 Tax=Allosalinactinospora lopnorensis TaxID=1352348 RepID=UPI0012E147E6|nr:hypothetical protein [Allosalinactinospora lopnorensis]